MTVKTLILTTGLFPDADTLGAAARELPDCRTLDLDAANMSDSDWDGAFEAILAADRVIAV